MSIFDKTNLPTILILALIAVIWLGCTAWLGIIAGLWGLIPFVVGGALFLIVLTLARIPQ